MAGILSGHLIYETNFKLVFNTTLLLSQDFHQAALPPIDIYHEPGYNPI